MKYGYLIFRYSELFFSTHSSHFALLLKKFRCPSKFNYQITKSYEEANATWFLKVAKQVININDEYLLLKLSLEHTSVQVDENAHYRFILKRDTAESERNNRADQNEILKTELLH